MRRAPEVIDTWFDSGSMHHSRRWHYPFENKEKFERHYPGDFIAEGVGSNARMVLFIAR